MNASRSFRAILNAETCTHAIYAACKSISRSLSKRIYSKSCWNASLSLSIYLCIYDGAIFGVQSSSMLTNTTHMHNILANRADVILLQGAISLLRLIRVTHLRDRIKDFSSSIWVV
jgi:hypothetical protein